MKVSRKGKGLEFANGHWSAAFDGGMLVAGGVRVAPEAVLSGDRRETDSRNGCCGGIIRSSPGPAYSTLANERQMRAPAA